MKITSYIKTLDILGETLTFTIKNRKIFQTVIGGFLSIFLYLSYFYFFYNFGLDFLFKRNPNTYSQTRYQTDNNYTFLNLSETEFLFGIRLEDEVGNNINYSEFFHTRLNLENNYFDKNLNSFLYEKKKMNLKTCDKLNMTKIQNSILKLNEWLCPDLSYSSELFIGGTWTDNQISYLNFEFILCEDGNENNCKDINSLLKFDNQNPLYISIIYPELIFDIDDYSNPFEIRFNNFYTTLDKEIGKKNYLYIMNNILEDDAGLIFETKNKTTDIGGSRIEEKIYSRKNPINSNYMMKFDKKSNSLHSLQILYDKHYFLHSRKYMKIQDLLGNVCGFMDLIVLIFGIFYGFYYKFRFDTYLFNRLVFQREDIYDFKNQKYFGVLNKINDFNFKTSDIMEKLEKNKKFKKIKNLFTSMIINSPNNDSDENGLKSPLMSLDSRKKLKKIRNSRIMKANKGQHSNRYSLGIDNKKKDRYKIDDSKEIFKREKIGFSISQKNNNNIEDYTKKNYIKTLQIYQDTSMKTENNQINFNPDLRKFPMFFEKYDGYKNSIKFNYCEYLKTKMFCNNKIKNKTHLMAEKYSDLLMNKLDLFYYLKNFKKQELINKILFNKAQIDTIGFISNKIYPFDLKFDFNQDSREIKNDLREEIENILVKSNINKNRNLTIDDTIKEIFYS